MMKSVAVLAARFRLRLADISTAMGDVKTENIRSSQSEWVISGDSSCLMHLDGVMRRKGMNVKPIHLAEVLASS